MTFSSLCWKSRLATRTFVGYGFPISNLYPDFVPIEAPGQNERRTEINAAMVPAKCPATVAHIRITGV
jgi:hypothetical protein